MWFISCEDSFAKKPSSVLCFTISRNPQHPQLIMCLLPQFGTRSGGTFVLHSCSAFLDVCGSKPSCPEWPSYLLIFCHSHDINHAFPQSQSILLPDNHCENDFSASVGISGHELHSNPTFSFDGLQESDWCLSDLKWMMSWTEKEMDREIHIRILETLYSSV